MVNISILISDYRVLFMQRLVMFNFYSAKQFLNLGKNKTVVVYCGLSTIKYQYHCADKTVSSSVQS